MASCEFYLAKFVFQNQISSISLKLTHCYLLYRSSWDFSNLPALSNSIKFSTLLYSLASGFFSIGVKMLSSINILFVMFMFTVIYDFTTLLKKLNEKQVSMEIIVGTISMLQESDCKY